MTGLSGVRCGRRFLIFALQVRKPVRLKGTLSLGLGLCTQTLSPILWSFGVLLLGKGPPPTWGGSEEDNCQGAEVRGCRKPLSLVPVSQHTLRGSQAGMWPVTPLHVREICQLLSCLSLFASL